MGYLRILTLVLATMFAFGCSHAESPGATPQEQQQLVDRWNDTVNANPSDFAQLHGFRFDWPSFKEFPHPTFKGGSLDAYEEFARLLLLFMQSADNFDYLAQHHLFDLRLCYELVNQTDDMGSFRELVDLAATGRPAFDQVDPTVRAGLQEIRVKISALP